LSTAPSEAICEVAVPNREGLHARPVMRFVDLASRFRAEVTVSNISGSKERVDGKSAMQMMLLEAVQGAVLRIEARGEDAAEAVKALAALVSKSFGMYAPNEGQAASNPPGGPSDP